LGIKIDACPGRLNQVNIFINRQGTFFGQCSEICGINHSFIPIVIESYDLHEHNIIVANAKRDLFFKNQLSIELEPNEQLVVESEDKVRENL